MKQITKDQILSVFKSAENPEDYITGLYRLSFPETWDKIKKVNGYPAISKQDWEFICTQSIKFDREHGSTFPGGLWFNMGFSADEALQPGQLNTDKCQVVY